VQGISEKNHQARIAFMDLINMLKKISTLLFLFLSAQTFLAIAIEDTESTLNKENPTNDSSIMPRYGNWCGLNHPVNIESAEDPIDDLDSICKTHDYCYIEKGYLSCECDSEFTNSIEIGLRENRFAAREKFFSHSFRTYFKNSPCNGDHRDKFAPTRTIQNVVKKAGDVSKGVIRKVPFIGEEE
jgi:hypothetical protein